MIGFAKSNGIKVIVTYHTPTVSCMRGSLMRWGNKVCSGVINRNTCSACVLQSKGLPKILALTIGLIPNKLSRILSNTFPGRLSTVFGMKYYAHLFEKTVQTRMQEANQIVAVCKWIVKVLELNKINTDKVIVSRQGVEFKSESKFKSQNQKYDPTRSRQLVVGYVGRVDKAKGIDVLIRSFNLIKSHHNLKLCIYGMVQEENKIFFKKLKKMAKSNPNISFENSFEPDALPEVFSQMDVLAVPSQWLETGPLVVYESFREGVPVLGSDLGGIAELVEDGINGVLVKEYTSPEEWKKNLLFLSRDQNILKLKNGIKSPRNINSAAEDMRYIYESKK